MKSICRFALVVALSGVATSPALAQSNDEEVWTGPYVGLQAGARYASGAIDETLVFDKDLDGQFDDMIATTAAPTVDLFAPGYCDGRAASDRVSGGCFKDKDKFDIAAHAGYDRQFGNLVVGLVAEYRYPSLTDSVSGFTSTPDAYVFRRKLQHEVGLRARAGYAAGNALFYVTGGGAWGKFKSDFITSNDDNTFVGTGKSGAWGWKAGAGIEQKLDPLYVAGRAVSLHQAQPQGLHGARLGRDRGQSLHHHQRCGHRHPPLGHRLFELDLRGHDQLALLM